MKEMLQLWRPFMEYWKEFPHGSVPEGMMLKPGFFDFMDWVSKQYDDEFKRKKKQIN